MNKDFKATKEAALLQKYQQNAKFAYYVDQLERALHRRDLTALELSEVVEMAYTRYAMSSSQAYPPYPKEKQ